jgi:arsenate reductase
LNPRDDGSQQRRLGAPIDHPHDHGALHAGGDVASVRVLFVCWGNSARSILAEALMRHLGGERVEVHSAGIEPRGVNPLTLRVLAEHGLPTDGLRSKSVEEYLGQRFDYVITVCDDTRDVCPVFPGVQESLHWGYPDPAKVEGTDDERLAAFRAVYTGLGVRIHQFLPLAERFAAERRQVELA